MILLEKKAKTRTLSTFGTDELVVVLQVVTSIEHWDEVAHEIFFQATKENSPGERHLYKVIQYTHCTLYCTKENSPGERHLYKAIQYTHCTLYCTKDGRPRFSASMGFYSTVFAATASSSNPWMVTHPSANRDPSCITSMFLGNWCFHLSYIFGIFFIC